MSTQEMEEGVLASGVVPATQEIEGIATCDNLSMILPHMLLTDTNTTTELADTHQQQIMDRKHNQLGAGDVDQPTGINEGQQSEEEEQEVTRLPFEETQHVEPAPHVPDDSAPIQRKRSVQNTQLPRTDDNSKKRPRRMGSQSSNQELPKLQVVHNLLGLPSGSEGSEEESGLSSGGQPETDRRRTAPTGQSREGESVVISQTKVRYFPASRSSNDGCFSMFV